MAVDFKTFLKVVPLVTANGKPVMLRGRHGIGKSQVVYQFADSIGRKVVERRASQMTEGDLIGMPSIEGNTTRFNPPDWFKDCCDNPRVLFLDEVDRAILEVRQGIFELTDSRKLNGHVLHPDTLVFAAVNGGLHGAQYQVGEMIICAMQYACPEEGIGFRYENPLLITESGCEALSKFPLAVEEI